MSRPVGVQSGSVSSGQVPSYRFSDKNGFHSDEQRSFSDDEHSCDSMRMIAHKNRESLIWPFLLSIPSLFMVESFRKIYFKGGLDTMATFRWISDAVPEGMKVTQVYAVLLDANGRTMLRLEKTGNGGTRYSLAGGRPEPFDSGIEDTCRRELLEEVNTEIETPAYIGYQLVDEENGTSAYAQVRMAALIRKIGEKRPDPDNGETYDRLLVSPEKAAALLNWGDVGTAQVMEARETIRRLYGIRDTGKPEEWV